MLLILVLMPAGCAVFKQQSAPSAALEIEDKTAGQRQTMPLAPPLGPARRIVQQLTAKWPGRDETLLCVLELDSRRIAMAGLTKEGLSLFELTYDGRVLDSRKNPMLPDSVDPELIIADLQLVFWPDFVLQKTMSKPWRLETAPDQRHLYYHGEHRVEVHYLSSDIAWPSSVELVNHHYHYRLRIQTISYETVSE